MAFSKKTWVNKPNTTTPLNATGLNDLENRIYNSDNALQTAINNLPQSQRIDSCDFNNLYTKKSGFFVAYGPCKNSPVTADNGNSTAHWYVVQVYLSDNYCFQLAHRLFVDKNIYIRRKNSSWEAWEKFTPTS